MDAQDDDNFSIWPGAKNQNLADNYPCIQSPGGGHSSQRKVNLLYLGISEGFLKTGNIASIRVYWSEERYPVSIVIRAPVIILNLAGGWLVISDGGAIRWHQPSAASITQIRHLDWVIDCKWKFMFQWFISKGCWEDWLMISRFLDTDSRPSVQALVFIKFWSIKN